MTSSADRLVHEFIFVDDHGWSPDEVHQEALQAAKRRGEMLEFVPTRVECTEGACTRGGQEYAVKVYGVYSNELKA
jgi:hypothetical protein